MVKHIVCYTFADNSPENLSKAKEVLLSMVGVVTEIADIEVGIDILHSPRSYDLCLTVVFDSLEKMAAYQRNQYHCQVVKKFMHEQTTSSVSVDYYID